ncbi:type II toxin-antitoxin system HicA family toxin [Methylosinus sporium]|uniref:type II toxin-antitoxin system HicA family toxin n=1 Tax=Methylosinus sporium TaxID=428 RepID=UPI00383B05D1
MTFDAFIRILELNGFALHRQGKGSHAIYRGEVDGEVRLVTVAAHRLSDDIKPGTLASMIRQSGLPKKHFR